MSNRVLIFSSRTLAGFDQKMQEFALANGWDIRVSSYIGAIAPAIPAWLDGTVTDPVAIVKMIAPGAVVLCGNNKAAHNYLFNTKRKDREDALRLFSCEYECALQRRRIKNFREIMQLGAANNDPEIANVTVCNARVRIDIVHGDITGNLIHDLQMSLGVSFADITMILLRNYDHALIVKNVPAEISAEFAAKLDS